MISSSLCLAWSSRSPQRCRAQLNPLSASLHRAHSTPTLAHAHMRTCTRTRSSRTSARLSRSHAHARMLALSLSRSLPPCSPRSLLSFSLPLFSRNRRAQRRTLALHRVQLEIIQAASQPSALLQHQLSSGRSTRALSLPSLSLKRMRARSPPLPSPLPRTPSRTCAHARSITRALALQSDTRAVFSTHSHAHARQQAACRAAGSTHASMRASASTRRV